MARQDKSRLFVEVRKNGPTNQRRSQYAVRHERNSKQQGPHKTIHLLDSSRSISLTDKSNKNKMTAKEFLRQYEELNRRARRYQQEYRVELEKVDAIGSTLSHDAGMPHGSGVSRKTEDKAIRLADKATKWKAAEIDALQKRQEVFEVIHDIEGVEGDILYERYINLRRWEDICVVIHMSWRQTHRLHRKALEDVSRKMALNGT